MRSCRGYYKGVACGAIGAIGASGAQGQIIPSSLILLSDIMQPNVGTLVAAAVGPGVLLLGMLKRWLTPPIPLAGRDAVCRRRPKPRRWAL